jgi:two-component system response regulator
MEPGQIDVLLVEDNPDDVALTLRALRKHNIIHGVSVLKDGAEALDHIFAADGETGRPRVILLDLKLPKIDGLEVLRRLKNDERTRTIPVVVLTSSGEHQDVLESYKLGVNSYIVKPVDFESFMRAVSELGLYWVHLNTTAE